MQILIYNEAIAKDCKSRHRVFRVNSRRVEHCHFGNPTAIGNPTSRGSGDGSGVIPSPGPSSAPPNDFRGCI